MKLLEYLLAAGVLGALRPLPLGALRRAGEAAAAAAWFLLPGPRRTALTNLERSFPDRDAAWARRTARECYRLLGRNLAEVLHLPRLGEGWIRQHVRFEGREHFDAARAEGRGVIALTFHFGNWELAGAVYPRLGIPVAAVAFPQTNRRLDVLIRRNREAAGMKVVYTGHRGTARILRWLESGGVVGLLADQNAGAAGFRLPFLGRHASVSRAPAVLSRRTGAPLLPHFFLREPVDRFCMKIFPPIRVPDTGNAERDLEAATREWLAVQEEMVRKHPEHYFWLHRRWKHYENPEKS